jgi:hypothetical protein
MAAGPAPAVARPAPYSARMAQYDCPEVAGSAWTTRTPGRVRSVEVPYAERVPGRTTITIGV